MNSIFSTNEFWKSYFTLEPKGVSQDDLVAQLNALRADFDVREETIHHEVSGRQYEANRRFVEFPFYCGDAHSIVIEYEPDVEDCGINLFLCDSRTETKTQMGWWDLAQWHPYCLRLDELDCLTRFWSRQDQRWDSPHVSLLLFCPFVGLPDSDTREILIARVEEARVVF